MLKTIKISVPTLKENRWKLTIKGTIKRKSVGVVYATLERNFNNSLASRLKDKKAVLVKYGQGYYNETIASDDAKYLLYATACFLEDYMSDGYLEKKMKKYLPTK